MPTSWLITYEGRECAYKGAGGCRHAFKSWTEFSGKRPFCKPCASASRRGYNLLVRRGITSEIYEWLLIEQAGDCALCGEPERMKRSGKILRLAVDHDHSCSAHDPELSCPQCIRGLLCCNCNSYIGRAEHSSRLKPRFEDYLARRPLAHYVAAE